ncbi:MAG: alpha/beta hydrolase [Clostridia bacterium]|nr:alpha/beta hydrolase [Clostridia bacterium]
MIHQVINLRDDDPDITLTTYVQDEGWCKRDAMLVIPGGGYNMVCSDREGEPIAMAFMARGVNAFVLHYSVKEKSVFPRPLADASLAMAYIKDHAEEFHIDPDRVFCVGFSAGGHLAASLGTLWHMQSAIDMAGIPYGKNKPAGMVLCYAVLSAFEMAHKGSFYNILGTTEPTDEQLALYSIERHIDERTVPTFFMHTMNDQVVPVENALYTAEAMSRAKIPFEMHIFPNGPHGVALGDFQTGRNVDGYDDAAVAKWVESAIYWMKNKVK